MYVKPYALTLHTSEDNGNAAPGLTVTLSAANLTGVTVPITESSPVGGTYTTPALAPGSYTASWTGEASGFADGSQGVSLSPTHTSETLNVSYVPYFVTGVITANSTPIPGATVCVQSALSTDPAPTSSCATNSLSSNKQSVGALRVTTVANGGYDLEKIPRTPTGKSYYLRVEAYGYQPWVSTAFDLSGTTSTSYVGYNLDHSFAATDVVSRQVTITITASDATDSLAGLAARTDGVLTKETPGGTSIPWPLTSNLTSLSFSAGSSSNEATLVVNQVPFGCWSFSYSLAGKVAGHYGTTSYSSLTSNDGTDLTCPADSILVSGNSSNSTAVSKSIALTEYPAKISVTADNNSTGLGAPTTADVVVTHTSDASTPFNGSVTANGTASAALAWLPAGDSVDIAVTPPATAVAAWVGSTISNYTPSTDSVPSASLTVPTKTVNVQVNGEFSGPLSGASLTLHPPIGYTGLSSTLTATSPASGTSSFTIPYGDGWTLDVAAHDSNLNDCTGCTLDSSATSFTVDSSTTSNSTVATETLTRQKKTTPITIDATPQYGATTLLDGQPVTLNAPSGWTYTSNCTAISSGSATCSNVPYGTGWTATVGGLAGGDFNTQTSSSFDVDASSPATDPTVNNVPQKTKSVVVHVDAQYGSNLTGATVTVTGKPSAGSGNTYPTPTCNGGTGGDYTCASVPYGTGWKFTGAQSGFVTQESTSQVVDSSTTNPVASLTLDRVTHTVTLTVTQGDGTTPLTGATVSVSGGTANPTLSGFTIAAQPTDSNGQVSFNLPSATGWSISVKYGSTVIGLVSGGTVDSTSTTSGTVVTKTQTITATVQNGSSNPVANETVTIGGGNFDGTLLKAFAGSGAGGVTGADGLATGLVTWTSSSGKAVLSASGSLSGSTGQFKIDNSGSNPILKTITVS
jgi:hypothetical protein